jgi:glucuronoarabinoxylan endo-1,4-beta-xylanase
MRKTFFLTTAILLLLPAIILSATSTINFSTTHQVIDGFGGSSAWCPAYDAATADALFGNAANQVGFTILRLRIDPNNNWATEKTNATMAKARGATVFATPWSPPPAYKTVNNVVGGAINTAHFADFAAWMKSFWTNLGSANVDIMSLQNEPDWSPNYECCSWTAQNFDDFCKTYAPQIGKPIMMPESMNYTYAVSNTALNDATAAANITYIGGHLYGGIPGTAYTLALNLGKHVWETEHYIDNDGATQCMQVASEIMACMNNLNMSAYCWWWMTYNNNATALIVNGSLTHRAWVIGQFSKWVRPGFVRVDATYAPQAGVNVVAFKGNKYVIVAENSNTTSQSVTFTCSNATIPSVTKYTSSQTKNGANDGTITATTNSFTTNLDAQSVTTFVSTNTVSIMNPYRGVEKPYGIATTNAAAHFVYMINGKRFSLKGLNEQGKPAPGIYIMPGKAQVSVGSNK